MIVSNFLCKINGAALGLYLLIYLRTSTSSSYHHLLQKILKTMLKQFVNHVRRTREAHPRKTLIAGNVVTGEMVEELILSGADIVKVSDYYSQEMM